MIYIYLIVLVFIELCGEFLLGSIYLAFELRYYIPVFFRIEGTYLIFALDDQPDGHGLNPPRTESPGYLLPQKRAQGVPDDPIQYSSRLLSVDELYIYFPGVFEGIYDGVFCYFIELHAVEFLILIIKDIFQVIAYRLSFPVRVGGQINIGLILDSLFEYGKMLLPVRKYYILRFEIVFHIHAELALRKINDVTHTRADFVIFPQEFVYRLCLRRRLDYYQVFGHRLLLFDIILPR